MNLWKKLFGKEKVEKFSDYMLNGIRFVRVERMQGTQFVYEIYTADSEKLARLFLDRIPKSEIPSLYYVIVETPKLNIGKDLNGLFIEDEPDTFETDESTSLKPAHNTSNDPLESQVFPSVDTSDHIIKVKNRNIRVFISSTFEGMEEERDFLILKIFFQLRQMCMERGVGFTEVDLRWGITEEDFYVDKVLPICLAEINNCRPYFIGLLGEYYGSTPKRIPDEVIEENEWLSGYQDRSYTELEIIHGVLENPDMENHAFFYFRDPAASPPSSQNKDKQDALKERIRKSGFPVRENYSDAKEVGERILEDLTEVINKEFPEKQLSPLERNRLDHEIFAETRTKVYIGRKEYFDRLNNFAQGNGDPLIVLGESGCGKTALLANWWSRFQEQHPDAFVLCHFIGASNDSTDCIAMLRRIMLEIKEQYDLPIDIPDKSDEVRSNFPRWLSMAAVKGKFVLIIDALNQLEDGDNEPDLSWLPEIIPPEVRLIVSTLPGQCLDALKKRNWPSLEIQLLEHEERKKLITDYLYTLYAKELAQEQVEQIASDEKSSNPLFLHALLEELRVYGKHKELQDRINHYLHAQDIKHLYKLILQRLEEDYEEKRPGLVRDSMTLIWAARKGLSQSELLDLLDTPPLDWTYIYLALQGSLVIRSGLITFFHDFLRQAIHDKYLNDEIEEKSVHLCLADYFEQQEMSRRKIEELPWQLNKANQLVSLKNCLSKSDFLKRSFLYNHIEYLGYWVIIENEKIGNCLDSFKYVLTNPDKYRSILHELSVLFFHKGHIEESLIILNNYVETITNKNVLQQALGNQANCLYYLGNSKECLEVSLREKDICQKNDFKDGLQASLGRLSNIYIDSGELMEALKYNDDQIEICKEIEKFDSLARAYCIRANIYHLKQNYNKALSILVKAESICNKFNFKNVLFAVLGNMAKVKSDLRKFDEALLLHKKEEKICREIGDKIGLSVSLGNQAMLNYDQNNLKQAELLFQEAIKLSKQCSRTKGIIDDLYNLSLVKNTLGKVDEALTLSQEALAIANENNLPLNDIEQLYKSLIVMSSNNTTNEE